MKELNIRKPQVKPKKKLKKHRQNDDKKNIESAKQIEKRKQ